MKNQNFTVYAIFQEDKSEYLLKHFEEDFKAREFVRKQLEEDLKFFYYQTNNEFSMLEEYFEYRKYSYKIIDSIEKDEAKRIQTEIKNLKLKVSAVNQGDTIRVTGKNIDDLQAVMRHLKSLDLKAPLVFDNFK